MCESSGTALAIFGQANGNYGSQTASVARNRCGFCAGTRTTVAGFSAGLLAALAAVTALALATGKAADALQTAVDKGDRLWKTLTSVSDTKAARRDLVDVQSKLREEMGIRREVIREANQSQSTNAAFVNSVKYYLVTFRA